MKRLINIRIPVLLAITLTAGIGIEYLFFRCDISPFYFIAVIPVAAIIFIICACTKKSNLCLATVALCAVFLIAGALNCGLRLYGFSKAELNDGDIYTISANVTDKGENTRGEYVVLKGVVANGEKADGKIIAYLSGRTAISAISDIK